MLFAAIIVQKDYGSITLASEDNQYVAGRTLVEAGMTFASMRLLGAVEGEVLSVYSAVCGTIRMRHATHQEVLQARDTHVGR